ncbi:MAG TPA: hypothetical protein VE861_02385 [Gemmatimonadaceae bacterium]|nr:hypothetical protein [Gemmatimonadaceae bacterium]
MLIWGSKGVFTELGAQHARHCPTCERDRPFLLVVQYKVHHIWYLFRWTTGKQYFVLCDVCRRGEPRDAALVEATLPSHPIPVFARYGWTLLAGLAVSFMITGQVFARQRASRTENLLQAPARNDLYVVNVSRLLQTPDSVANYGVLRVRTVTTGGIEFDVPAHTYRYGSDAAKDISMGRVTSDGYFDPRPIQLAAKSLESLHRDGAIYAVERE